MVELRLIPFRPAFLSSQALVAHLGPRVGNLLKKLYIDSALRKAEKIDKKTGKKVTRPVIKPKKITYAQFKNMES